MPFERLVEAVAAHHLVDRSLNRAPLFQILFLLQNAPMPALEFAGLGWTPVAAHNGAAKFDLTLALWDDGQGLAGSIEYDADLFDAGTVDRLVGHFEALLAGAVADPGQPVSELPLLTGTERSQIAAGWDGGLVLGEAACLHELFTAQAARTPGDTALVSGSERLTYGELADRVRRLARRLAWLGVRPEVPVGICAERTPEMVIGMLAVLSAGGAYVPLDPKYPAQRLRWILEDLQEGEEPPLVLAQRRLLPRLEGLAARTVCVDEDWPAGEEVEPRPAGADNLAYVIHTSGSTGRPKGVAIEHRTASLLVPWSREVFSDGEMAGMLASTSINFDLSVFELFVPLSRGGKLILADNALELSVTSARDEVSLINTVPSAMAELVRMGGLPASARTVCLAGEALSRALVDSLYATGTVDRVWNLYGPSEDTTYSTGVRVPRGEQRAPTIGRPLPGTRSYVLDRHLKPLPLGVPGELFLAGAGLTRGYLRRPDLTAERYVPDPFGPPGTRMYRTGDLVRLMSDGQLEYLGRVDHQVKIRGFRIELGEIEAALAAHEALADAVVLAPEDHSGGRRLIAYAVPAPAVTGEAPSGSELRDFLRRRLPEFMVPSGFVFLPELPRTPNGKVDRRALALLEPVKERGEEEAGAPLDPTAELLAGIWSDVLGIDQIGAGADFFDLGGHSLLATRVVARVREVFGVDLPLRALFETPGLTTLASRIGGEVSTGLSPIPPVPRDGLLPLSFSQERLWFLDQLDPGSAAYNVPFALSLSGDLDVPALAAALAGVVCRHEALRTTFLRDPETGHPVQVIAPAGSVALPVIDLSALPEAAEAARLGAEEARRPFDLACGPLHRFRLLRTGEREHRLIVSLHHTVSDGWSIPIFLRELAALYGGSSLPELPVQYADYAVWQRVRLSSPEVLEAQMAYWRERLAGAPEALDLPLDHPRPAVQSLRGGRVSATLPEDLVRELRVLARRQGTTPFMVFLAGFQALLARLSGQEDVLVGSPVANRGRIEIEGLIGFFVNTLTMRGDLSGDPGFAELLARTRESALGAWVHQDIPFERLVEELRPERGLSRAPLFQVLLTHQAAPDGVLELPGLAARVLELASGTAKLELTLGISEGWENAEGIETALEYDADLFDPATAGRLLERFTALLAAAAADPGRGLWDLPLLGEAERHQLLLDWNDSDPDVAEICLHQLFAAQARRTPGLPALVFGSSRLSYAELDERAGRWARRLAWLGVGPEVMVGICAERSPEMVVGMLAVLKAGGAYVPLDPKYPTQRLAWILEDLQDGITSPVVLTQRRLLPRLEGLAARPVCLDEPWPEGEEAEPRPAELGNLAYVIYTSGSTGRPKGVAIEHRTAAALVPWSRGVFSDEEMAGVLASTSINFDMSVFELWVTLARGGKLILAANALELPSLPAKDEVTLIDTVPSAIAELVRAGGIPASARTVNLGGEALSRALVDAIYGAAHVERVWNLYGPSEDTTFSTFVCVPRGERRAPTIGRPLAGTPAYVLDRRLQPTPLGVPGELFLGGAGLSRGYLGCPDLTAERYLPDPFGPPGSRMYRTSDLVRYLPDGQLDYLGRMDHQVKVRGFRIELGEVEAALAVHEALGEVVVVAREDRPGDRRLVGYAVPSPGAEPPPAAELREFLRLRLPEFMVPSDFVLLPEMPRTPNGKVDRKALPAPDEARASSSVGFVAPRTPEEELLAGIWSELLGVERVGVEDDFFDLGGHSILATRVAARVRAAFGVELPLRALFETPTVAGIAALVEQARRPEDAPEVPPIAPAPRAGEIPLAWAQERLWFLDRLKPGGSAYNVPVAVRLTGTLDPARFADTLAAVARRHEVLRTRFAEAGGRPVQVIDPEPRLPLRMADVSGLPGDLREGEARRLVAEDARSPFDLVHGPLGRALLIQIGDGEYLALLNLHHIVTDGWSTGVLLFEIAALYVEAPLPELPVQYADYALWQREWLQGAVLEAQIDWWRERLDGAPPELPLPADRPRPARPSFRGDRVPVLLPQGIWKELKALSRARGATPYIVLLAAFQALLARLSGEEDVLVGTPVANRRLAETEGLIGCFINTLVMRTPLMGDPPFLRIVERAREAALGAWAHQDVPFERLVEVLQPERDLSRPPFFQVVLVLQNAPLPVLELPGLIMEPVEAETGTAKFDLTLSLAERDGGASGWLEYGADRFDAVTAERIAEAFERLVAAAMADPRQRLSELPLPWEDDFVRLRPTGPRTGRRDLAALATGGEGAWRAPRTLLEETLADLWTELLGVERVGLDDDFFKLGGHSLLGACLVSRVCETLEVDLPLAAVFEATTLEALATVVEEARREGQTVETPPIVPRPREGDPALSFAQERLWFLNRLDPESPAYNVPVALRLAGDLDLTAFQRALDGIVRRHEALRTTFPESGPEIGGRPVQRIAPPTSVPLSVIDLSGLPEEEREAERRLREEAGRPFDLRQGPVVRAALLRLGERDHVALLTLHHIVSDGWSMGVLVRELSALYTGSPLPDLPIQYADYAEWQREWLAGGVLEAQLAWWRERLEGVPAVLELPTDRPRPAVQSLVGGALPMALPADLSAGLLDFAQRENATLFMVLLAGFQALLSRWTGQEDLLVGTPVANRGRGETEGLIGLFVNTLALRGRPEGGLAFRALLGQAREESLAALARQDLPFERLVEELRPDRDLSRPPLFQVMLIHQNAPLGRLELPGLVLRPVELPAGTAKFELTLALTETGGTVGGTLEYAAALFDPATVRRLAAHFETLLRGAVEAPETRVAELPLLTAAEREQIEREWVDDRVPPGDTCLHQLFEAQARRTPEAIALVCGRERLTYRDLNRRANRLAHRLRGLGIGPEKAAGVCLERSESLVVALLAVLKAGGAYVPLDPTYPPERLAFVAEDSRASVLLSRESLLRSLPGLGWSGPVLCLDAEADALIPESVERDADPGPEAEPGNLAYLIYTSGSTGRPKGAAIEHASAVALVRWAREVFLSEDLAGVLASTSIAFDLSVFELFVPLSWGGTVVLAGNALDLPGIETQSSWSITLVNTVPSAMAELVRMGGVPASVRTVNLAGEPLQRVLAERIHERTAAGRLFNLYGPSEDTTYSTFTEVLPGEEPTIGRPLPWTQGYVLDGGMRLVPVGVHGELFLGGAGLARGYLYRPELTAEKFVPNPFGTPGTRLYRTGDLVRWLPDGQLEFLGRRDFQVKIRGFRIELGEIEAALAVHPGVSEAVVLALKAGNDTRLVAFWAGEEGADLRSWLRRTLPDHMVPSGIVRLDVLPLTPNGKVDRQTLAKLGAVPLDQPEIVADTPASPLEELLAGLWADVLRVERVGVHANFFELGGHALLATQIVSRVREALGVELPLRALFGAPTVAALAVEVEKARGGTETLAPPIVPIPRDSALPLSYSQERLWFLDQLEPGTGTFNIPAAVWLTGCFRPEVFDRSLTEIVRRHEALRTTFGMDGERPVQVIAPPAPVSTPLIDLSRLPEEAHRLAAEEAARPFDLSRGPLMRSALLRLGPEEHVALVTMHHVVSDGWSMGVFLRELTDLYEAFAANQPSPLPELPVQYADFGAWQRAWLAGPVLERQVAYWRERLAGASQGLDLPTDRPRPAVQTFRPGQLSLHLPAGLSDGLRALSRREGATLFMTLLATFELLLSRHSGQEDLSVGTPIAGRGRAEAEGLIGLFLNTLVLRSDLSGDPTFRELVARVRETALGAYAHQDVPFEKLLEEVRAERDLSRTPFFQVMFNMLNFPEVNVELPDLVLQAVPPPAAGSKFDLTLYVSDRSSGIGVEWVYNADLFDEARIALLARQFESLLSRIVEQPWREIGTYALLTEADRALLPDPAAPLAPEWHGAVHEGVVRAARSAPERPAILEGNRVRTYGELDSASDGLAHRLREQGIGTGDVVAVYAQRNAALVLALLGTLKAGAAFLVLDAAYPEARLASCLTQARPRALLETAGPLPAGLEGALSTLCRIAVPEDWATMTAGADLVPVTAGADDLAYVAFTSGSTGVPKGILGSHGPLSHFLTWHMETFGFTGEDRFSMLSGLAHDPLLRDVFTPLCLGATLCIPRPAEMVEPEKLVAWLADREVTVAHLTPAMGQLLDSGAAEAALPALRWAFFGGGVLNGRDVVRLRRLAPVCTAVNFYGTTETPQAMGFHIVDGEPPEGAVPLGRGIDGVQLLVLSRSGDLAAPGERGEIQVRTPHLAKGYLGDPGLTSERFLTNPWTGSAEDRLYRTGDLGRYRLDGTVEFLGRVDDQVSIRGFRVEPGEVQAVLHHHQAVKEAAVVAVPGPDGPGLAAYVVPEGEPRTSDLRQFLRQRLPDYMVPSHFLILEALPLTPNGKVDRRALPAPGSDRPDLESAYVEPGTELERTLAGVWREVLGIDRVGVHDNFFELGGSSLAIARVRVRLRKALQRDLALVDLFRYPTVADLAAHLDRPIATAQPPSFAKVEERVHRGKAALQRQQRMMKGKKGV